MNTRKLSVFAGRANHVQSSNDPIWEKTGPEKARIYICAHSRTDAQRLIEEYTGTPSAPPHEVRDYFSDEWGYKMKNVERQRGIWVDPDRHDRDSETVRVY
jgi:hypothetical protein